jgi:putative effector of murein hydrolase LrgA (UPF0299 family)
MQEIGLLRLEWLPIGLALVGSCIVTIAVTGLVMEAALRAGARRPQHGGETPR